MVAEDWIFSCRSCKEVFLLLVRGVSGSQEVKYILILSFPSSFPFPQILCESLDICVFFSIALKSLQLREVLQVNLTSVYSFLFSSHPCHFISCSSLLFTAVRFSDVFNVVMFKSQRNLIFYVRWNYAFRHAMGNVLDEEISFLVY